MLILLSGYSGAGKSIVARMLVEKYGYGEFPLAQGIKQGLANITGLSLTEIETAKNVETSAVRQALQAVGEVACERDPYHWCKQTARRIGYTPDAVVSDVRKVYERDYFKQLRVEVVHVQIVKPDLDLTLPKYQHITENAVEELAMLSDYTIVNDGTLDEVASKCVELLSKIKEKGELANAS